MLTLYLARHGQTDWNKARRLQGWTDIELNQTGRAQAAMLRRRLEGEEIDHVYASSLARAKETAWVLEDMATVSFHQELWERGMGGFEGDHMDGRDSERAEEFQSRKFRPGDDLDGGESVETFQTRIDRFMSEIIRARSSGTIVVVGHGGTNSMILGRFMGLDIEGIRTLWVANDDLFKIETPDGRRGRVWHELIDPRRTRSHW